MWIFTKKGFISVVEDRDDPDAVLVRARFPGDLEALLAVREPEIEITPDADYRYRTRMARIDLADALSYAIEEIDYDNFKDAAGPERHQHLVRIWEIMRRAQEGP